mgnify:CR=1 FL=1
MVEQRKLQIDNIRKVLSEAEGKDVPVVEEIFIAEFCVKSGVSEHKVQEYIRQLELAGYVYKYVLEGKVIIRHLK